MMLDIFRNREIKLNRYPITKDQSLKAWNAADEYLLEFVAEKISQIKSRPKNILICNDQFGALTCSIAKAFNNFSLIYWTDSFLSKTAINKNLSNNNISAENVAHVSSLKTRKECDAYDLVILRVPKHNSLLEYQLHEIAPYINENTLFVAGGMTKEIHTSTLSIFEKMIGDTKTTLAKKKARLILPAIQAKPAFKIEPLKFFSEETSGVKSYGLPGVFSRERLDVGTRVLLKHLPKIEHQQSIVDLGCGTGIIGTRLAKLYPTCRILFCDESYLAIESAKLTYTNNIEQTRDNANEMANFDVTDVLQGVDHNQFNHIVCNPPFHQQNVRTLSIANRMFKQSASRLRENGTLTIVANRHLKYKPMLKQYFNQVKSVSNDPKFIVWLAENPIRK